MLKTIKVGIVPGALREFAVETGTTVRETLRMAGLAVGDYEIKVDGSVASLDSTIKSSTQNVFLVKKVKGNALVTVKVGIVPGSLTEIAVETGTTFKDALGLAGLTIGSYELKVNGSVAEPTDTVKSTTQNIFLVKKVKGNF